MAEVGRGGVGLNCQLEEMGLAGTGSWELWWALELRSQRWRRVFFLFFLFFKFFNYT